MKLKLDKSAIIWPGNTDKQPPGFMIPTHLKVLTIEEKPFVYVREIQAETEGCTLDEIPCPHFNNTNDGAIRFLTYFVINYVCVTEILSRSVYGSSSCGLLQNTVFEYCSQN